ncbi:MAG: hypothetical protein JWQ16_1455 [Novosphingobium sp.]|nr:hypothetical protein [Novosphingobium sp.]
MLSRGVRPLIDARNATPTKPVILNLFQDPSGRMRRAAGMRTGLAGSLANSCSARVEKWTLKRVQGDEVSEGKTKPFRVEFVR